MQYRILSDLDNPCSLRDLLTNRSPERHPKTHRFRLANHLSSSIRFVRSGQFVRKAIKPENILLLTKSWAPPESQFPSVLGLPFLVGFYRCHPISDEFENRYGKPNWKTVFTDIHRDGALLPNKHLQFKMTFTLSEWFSWRSGYGNHSSGKMKVGAYSSFRIVQ